MKPQFSLSPLWLALLACGFAHAQSSPNGATVVIGMGAEHTDNAYRSSVFERSELKEYLDLDLGYTRESESLLADILYTGEIANYEHDTTEDDSVVQGRSSVSWRALPGRLQFDGSHERSEQLADSRSPDIRSNRQLRDIVSAGPEFTARMSAVDDLVLSGRYTAVSYDDSDRTDTTQQAGGSDSERMQGGLAWMHRLSKTDVLSMHYQYVDTEFDEQTDAFVYQRLFGTYAVQLRSGGYTVSLGANRSERDDTGDSDGFLAQVDWNLQTGGHRFGVVGMNELTDSGIGLGGNSLVNDDIRPSDSNFDVIDVVERTRLDLNYGFDRLCERCTVDIGATWDSQDFDTQPRDQEQAGLRVSFGYRLTSNLRASLRGSRTETEFTQESRTDERSQYGMALDWRLSRPLSARLWLTHDERESDAADQGYKEFYGGVSVRYQLR